MLDAILLLLGLGSCAFILIAFWALTCSAMSGIRGLGRPICAVSKSGLPTPQRCIAQNRTLATHAD
jgi:hypothetical protein